MDFLWRGEVTATGTDAIPLAHMLSHAHSVGRSQTPCHLCRGEDMFICVGGGNHSPDSSRPVGTKGTFQPLKPQVMLFTCPMPADFFFFFS